MNAMQYKFYECDNPECKLRFPGSDSLPRWNLCPVCRSKIHQVAIVDSSSVKIETKNIPLGIHMEVLLDNIRSGFNVGSILRTADGIGISKVYFCGITPTPENLKVRKTALNAEVEINWEKHNNGYDAATALRDKGYRLWALETIDDSEPLFSVDISPSDSPIILIVGNEVTGIDPGIIEICEKVISIPMFGKKGSYNVAIAFGIAASYLVFRSLQHIQ